jgi:hypothetical protein
MPAGNGGGSNPAAGVRKPPGEETAMGERVVVPRALWGFDGGGWGFGLRTMRLIATVVDLRGYHEGAVEVFAGFEP